MAQHRRVEPRGIVGTGMATDPERIQNVEDEHERRARAWRNAPEKGFGDVLADAPARGELEDEAGDDPRRRKRPPDRPSTAPDPAAMSTDALAAKPEPAPAAKAPSAKAPQKPLPRAVPDPREALLRKQLEQRQKVASPGQSMDTPPTGKTRKPS